MKILGLVGSQRKDGNSYLILKEALEGSGAETEIIQLAEADVKWCDACGLCKSTMKCVIEDDVEPIFNKLKEADAVMISTPRYLPIPSKFMALTERIGALHHYCSEIDPHFRFPLEQKPFGLIVVSAGGGRQAFEALKEVAFQVIHYWRMKLVTIDSHPYLGVLAKGEKVGEVLQDRGAINQAKKLIKELVIKCRE